MAITISNLRISPYAQKDVIKPIFGDTMTLTFTLPEAFQEGDEYTLALDYERIIIPTDRPVCALTTDYSISGNDITFALLINTERFALWVSRIKKPTPCWLQIQRKRGDIYETILLDDVLALPSVIDGANTVFPGSPVESAIAGKLDKPAEEGEAGNVLKLGSDGQPVWGTGGGGGGDVTWNDIQDKPNFATVASTGDYADLLNTPTIPTVNNATITFVQGSTTKGVITLNQATASTITLDQGGATSWDEITDKPTFATVASTGSYNDLVSKPTLATVATTGLYSDLVSAPTLAPVATTGSYADLTGKPTLATVASTGNYADLTGTPTLATVASTGSYEDLISKPTIPTVNDAVISFTQGGVSKGSFSLNQSEGATIALESYTLNTDIITIPVATTSYALADGLVYQHSPSSATTYQLPLILDTTHTHTIVLTIQATYTTSWQILDQGGGSVLVPIDTITPVLGDEVQYLFQSTPSGTWAASVSYLYRGA